MANRPGTSERAARSRGALFVLLTALLASVYVLVYSARIESGDSLMLFDAVSSWVDHGDLRLDLAAWHRPPSLVGDFDLARYDIEPLQVLLASPLYALAKAVPMVGMAQVVWLFNVIVCALAGGVMALYAAALGYSHRTAAAAGLCLGLLTIVLPYSKSFFREPLLMLMLLGAGLGLEHLRQMRFRPSIWWIVAVGCTAGVALTKASGLVALPALVLIALPSLRVRLGRPVIILVSVGAALLALYLAASAAGLIEGRYNLIQRLLDISGEFLGVALPAYLISPNASIWGTSPILLLALPGIALSLRGRRARYPLVGLTLLWAYALVYAAFSAGHWFGGLSLPPRFLLPVVPFLLIIGLPALDRVLHSRNAIFWIGLALLIVYSAWWQFTSAALWWGDYPAALPPESGGRLEWQPGFYDLRYLRPIIVTGLLSERVPDFAWMLIDQPVWALVFVGIAAGCAYGLIMKQRRFALLVLPIIGVIGLYMAALYRVDPRYDSQDAPQNEPLFALLDAIDAETGAGDVILLASPRYGAFFSNSYRGAARIIALMEQPGEQPSPEQPPQVRSDNPDMLLTPITIPMIHRLAAEHDRLWLVVEFSPELAWSVRPVERFMVSHYYPIREFRASPTARLIAFSTAHAPDRFGFRGADIPTDLVYGESLRLLGLTAPAGLRVSAGDPLPISLHWALDAPTDARLTVALFLRTADGAPVAQNDWQPGYGFDPTDSWTPGLPVWDHRAFDLPPDLAPGTYQLWVKVYDFIDGAPRDLPVTGSQTLDGVIGVLPVTVTVRAPG